MKSQFAALAGLAILSAAPAFADGDAGSVYVVRSRNIQCIKAPCPVWEALEVATCKQTAFDAVDLRGVGKKNGGLSHTRQPITVRGNRIVDPATKAVVLKVTAVLDETDPRAAKCAAGQE